MPLLLLGVGEESVTETTADAWGSALTPDGGFLAPLLPPTYLQDWDGAATQVAPLDQQVAAAWAFLQAVLDDQDVRVATGSALIAIGQKYGVQQVAGEGSEQLRARIIGTMRARTTASSAPGLTDRLQQATGVPVLVMDDPTTAGYFIVTFFGSPPQGPAIVALIQEWKAAGTDFTAAVRATTLGQIGRLGTFRLGDVGLGGGQSYTMLHAPLPVTGHGARLGTFRLGEQRL